MNNFILLLINLNRCVDNNLIFYEIARQRNLNIEAFFIATANLSNYFWKFTLIFMGRATRTNFEVYFCTLPV